MLKCLLSKDQIRQWIADLRSGEFAQAREVLYREADTAYDEGYCCLGVLAKRLGTLKRVKDDVVLHKNILGRESELITLNDEKRFSFPQIADWIEKEILPSAPDQMVPGALDLPEEEYNS